MNEKEKMLLGKWYDATDQELVKQTKWAFTKFYIRQNMYMPIVDMLKKSNINRVWNSNLF